MVLLRWTWGLLVLCLVAASPPRYTRQSELDDYTDNNVDFEEHDDPSYEDYDEGNDKLGEFEPAIPDEDINPAYSASLDEKEEEEIQFKHEPVPARSEEKGTLMGPSAQGEEELRRMPTDILQISGDHGSADVTSGDLSRDRASGSGEHLGSGEASGSGSSLGTGSGASGEISGSGDSVDDGSAESGLSGSGIIIFSGGEEALHPMFQIHPHKATGEFEESGISWLSGVSGLSEGSGETVASGVIVISGVPEGSGVIETSGVSGASGVLEGSAESGFSGIPEGSAESGFSGIPEGSAESGFPGIPEGSAESGFSGIPEGSAESGFSGIPDGSAESGFSGIPEGSAESGVSGIPELSGDAGLSKASGESGFSGVPDIPGYSGELEVFKVSKTSEVPITTMKPRIVKPEPFDIIEESGTPEETEEAPDITPTFLIPEEEELLFPSPIPPLKEEEEAAGEIGSGLPDIYTDIDEDITGMSTCLLCTCLVGSVYCDDRKLERVPPLTKDVTHFYGRYNRISRISKSSFANLNKLKRIDLTSNDITRIDDDAFFGLPALEELILRENSIRQLPALPSSMILIDASLNQLGSNGIQREAFKEMSGLLYLYLTDDNIDHVPVPLPDSLRSLHLQNNNIQMVHDDTFCNPHNLHYTRNALEDIRLDGNPINLSRTPQAYICLPRIPIGALI